MKFYLSSFKFGKEKEQLKQLAPKGRIAIIPNALDFREADDERTVQSLENKIERLEQLGLQPEVIDLKDYFGREEDLKKVIEDIGAVFVLGGNVFVLRRAMRLSGLDTILTMLRYDPDFLYSGYSAAGCVLAPSLKPYEAVDASLESPYPEYPDVIWEGLGFVDFAFMPHWDSDHPETEAIGRGIEYCKEQGIEYKAVRDGEVLIF